MSTTALKFLLTTFNKVFSNLTNMLPTADNICESELSTEETLIGVTARLKIVSGLNEDSFQVTAVQKCIHSLGMSTDNSGNSSRTAA